MRYIPLLAQTPPQDLVDKAERAAAEVEVLKNDRAARNKLIGNRAYIWGEWKNWLLELSNQKCWFSEAKDCFQDWDVEHFRPKKSAKDLENRERDGYWWLSFDWRNYRICGRVGNVNKSTYFPVRGNSADENHRSAIEDEIPYLLDPINKFDCLLLSFNQLGEAIPAPGLDEWNSERVTVSVEIYKLNFIRLEQTRKEVWDTCTAIINQIQHLLADQALNPSASKIAKIEEKMDQLKSYTKRDRVCSSAAIACIQKSEIGWAVHLTAESD